MALCVKCKTLNIAFDAQQPRTLIMPSILTLGVIFLGVLDNKTMHPLATLKDHFSQNYLKIGLIYHLNCFQAKMIPYLQKKPEMVLN